jgi:AraC-like DNA-binding protein
MSARTLSLENLRQAVWQSGFRVKRLASWAGMDVRTLERRFDQQLRTTPKAWIIGERMAAAPDLLARRFSNKEVAARLGYGHESSFCRDFKRRFGCTPREFVRRARRPDAAEYVAFC